MRESVFFELRLRRFGVWQVAVWLVAGAAIASAAAWAVAMFDSQPESGRALVMAVAAGLSLATIGLAFSLARVEVGLLTCSDGVWTFAPDAGARCSGTLEVAMDLGAFLLLRLVERRRTIAWLPVQRRGVETQWHALRCAVYSPPPLAAGAPTAPALASE
jgi:hypothetical protein